MQERELRVLVRQAVRRLTELIYLKRSLMLPKLYAMWRWKKKVGCSGLFFPWACTTEGGSQLVFLLPLTREDLTPRDQF